MTLAIGTNAPTFALPDTEGNIQSLSDYKGKNLVIAFFPAVFSGVCDTEMCVFRDSLAELNSLDTDVVAISVDMRFATKEFVDKHGLGFPVLSDYRRQAIKSYDVEFHDFAGMDGLTVARRSVFVLDKTGVIQWVWEAPAQGEEPDYGDVNNAVRSLS